MRFRRRIDALDEVFAYVDGFLADRRVEGAAAFAVRLAVEELFTNLVRHGPGGRDFVEIGLESAPGRLTMRLRDFDTQPFDPHEIAPPDLSVPLRDRRSGGLGLHLLRNLVDQLDYEFAEGTLSVTAVKNLEGPDVRD